MPRARGDAHAPPPLATFLGGGEPLPLSAFLDVSDAAAAPAVAEPVPDIVPLGVEPCLLAPDYLGVHQIASLGEELSLHDGRLRVWCGAALHNDHTAAMLEARDAPTVYNVWRRMV